MRTDLTLQECETILQDNHYGHLGSIDGDEPYVIPITYVFHDGFLYAFLRDGKKSHLMKSHPKI